MVSKGNKLIYLGTMEMYASSLKTKYCEETSTYSPIYGASEVQSQLNNQCFEAESGSI